MHCRQSAFAIACVLVCLLNVPWNGLKVHADAAGDAVFVLIGLDRRCMQGHDNIWLLTSDLHIVESSKTCRNSNQCIQHKHRYESSAFTCDGVVFFSTHCCLVHLWCRLSAYYVCVDVCVRSSVYLCTCVHVCWCVGTLIYMDVPVCVRACPL